MDALDLKMLIEACRANGLPTSGTKPELWARLKSGKGDQRKKGAKDTTSKGSGIAVTVKTSPASPAFVSKEYAQLKASGFDDEDEIAKIIDMRWNKRQELLANEDLDPADDDEEEETSAADSFMYLPVYLTANQALKSKLVIVDETRNDKGMYKYRKVTDTDDVQKVSPAKAANAAGKVKVEEKVDASASKLKKRKAGEIEEEESAQPEMYDRAGAVHLCIGLIKDRIHFKVKQGKIQKQQLHDFLASFDAPIMGKATVDCATAAEQLLMETDDEDAYE